MPSKQIIKRYKMMEFNLRDCMMLSQVEVAKHSTTSGSVGRIYLPSDWIGKKAFVVVKNE